MQDAISNRLVEIITGIQYDGSAAFAGVYDYDNGSGKYDNWPVAMVLPDDQPSEHGDNTEVHRREGFNVFILMPLGDEGEARQKVYSDMRKLSDLVRNAVDATIDLNGLRANYVNPNDITQPLAPEDGGKPLDKALGVVPASAGWSTVDTPAGIAIMQTVNVTVRYDHFTGN
jgi:hypothetical protein